MTVSSFLYLSVLPLSFCLFSLLRVKNHGCGKICKPSQKHACESPVPLGLVHGPPEQQVPSCWASHWCLSRRVYTRHSSTEEKGPTFHTVLWQCRPLQIPTTELTSDPGHHPGKPTARPKRGKLHLQVTPVMSWVKNHLPQGLYVKCMQGYMSPTFTFSLPSVHPSFWCL